MTAAGLVVVSDLVPKAVRRLQHTVRAPQGRWVTVGTFLTPRGLAVDALDHMPGAVHSFTLGPALEPPAPASMLGLEGPCWVGLGPDGGLAVSEEFGDVWLFGSARQPLCSLGDLTEHHVGTLAGVCTDAAGSVIVADEQQRQVTLFPWARAPICLVSKGLRWPLGVALCPRASSWWRTQRTATSKCTSPTWNWPDLVGLNGSSPSLCVGPVPGVWTTTGEMFRVCRVLQGCWPCLPDLAHLLTLLSTAVGPGPGLLSSS